MSNTTHTGSLSPSFVCVLFFVSGAAALTYETSWSRLVGLSAGNTAQATALVLAAMFVGMAVGQFIGGRIIRQVPPMLAYGIAELIAAAWACVIPVITNWVGDTPWLELDQTAVYGLDIVSALCFLALLPATIPLGATLPFVAAALIDAEPNSRQRLGWAYCCNTAGGVIGVIASMAFLLVSVGVAASGMWAAGASAVCGLVACIAGLVSWRHPSTRAASPGDPSFGGGWGWYFIAAVSGFATLGLEVLYTRMFSLVFHNSTYTFGAVVAAFLLFLSLGAALATRWSRQFNPRTIAAAGFSTGGVAVAVSVAAFPWITGLNYFSFGATFAAYISGAIGLLALFLLLPVTFLGMVLPAAIQAVDDSAAVGRISAINSLAAGAGAIVAGFVISPALGLWTSFGLLAAGLTVSGVLLFAIEGRIVPSLIFTFAGMASIVAAIAGPEQESSADVELLRRQESAYGWIDVVRQRENSSLEVRQNLHYRYGSTANAEREYRQGRLPLLLHEHPTEVAFLGLGTGLTAAPAVADQDVERVVVVELIPEVADAARLLASANLGVVDHPKVALQIDDARHYLLRSSRHFDAVISDLFVPWHSRTGYLYTIEFYQLVRRRLQPNGLFCQWIALYQVSPEQFELIADSFADVFPNTTVWWGQLNETFPIVALIGAEKPLTVDTEMLRSRAAASASLPGGDDPALRDGAGLPFLYLGEWKTGRSAHRNTDEHPWLEFTPASQESRQAVHGAKLKAYFDRVLSRLPAGSIQLGGALDDLVRDEGRRRSLQRLSLFSEVEQAE